MIAARASIGSTLHESSNKAAAPNFHTGKRRDPHKRGCVSCMVQSKALNIEMPGEIGSVVGAAPPTHMLVMR